MLPGDSTPKNANGGASTAKLGIGILKAHIRGCDWDVNAILWEILHASSEYIPEGVMGRDADQVPAHRTTKIPKVNNI